MGEVFTAAGAAVSNRKARKQSQQQFDKMYDLQKGVIDATTPYGKSFLAQSQKAATPAMNYYQSIMSGDRYKTQEALAPELNSIASRYRGAASAQRSLYPRGSGMNASNSANSPFQAAGEQSNLMMGSRGEAAGKLSQLAGMYGSLGLNAYGLSSNVGSNMFDASMKNRAANMASNQALGQSLYGAGQSIYNWYQNRQSGVNTLPQGNSLASMYGTQGSPGLGVNYGVTSNPYSSSGIGGLSGSGYTSGTTRP